MALKSAYTEQRIQQLVDEAVAKHTMVGDDGSPMVNLPCEYLAQVPS